MIKAGIIEGTGYKAGELLRLLVNHPDVNIKWISSQELGGMPVTSYHRGLIGETELQFADCLKFDEVDVIFICSPAKNFDFADVPENVKIIDMTDAQLNDASLDDTLSDALVYALPEHSRKALVRGATRAMLPNEVASIIELSLLPLAEHMLLNNDIHSTVVSGSTEANDTLNESIHSERTDNVAVSSLLDHSAKIEIDKFLKETQPSWQSDFHLLSITGDFTRGILAVTYLDCPVELSEIRKLYEETYSDHNFTFICDHKPDLKDVVNTNKCLIYLQKSGDTLAVVTVLDNLLKGSAGNAVHTMNLLFGLHERTGLNLKASAL